jgi:hypothetical protein
MAIGLRLTSRDRHFALIISAFQLHMRWSVRSDNPMPM